MQFSKLLRASAVALVIPAICFGQPSAGGAGGAGSIIDPGFALSYQASDATTGMTHKLDLWDSGLACAIEVVSGQKTEGWGWVPADDLADICAAADQLFAAPDLSQSTGGAVCFRIMRWSASCIQVYESDCPSLPAWRLIMKLERAYTDILANQPVSRDLITYRVPPPRPVGIAPFGGQSLMGKRTVNGPVSKDIGKTGVPPKQPVGKNINPTGVPPKQPVHREIGGVRAYK